MAFAPGLTLLGVFAMATYGIDSFRVLAECTCGPGSTTR